MIACTLLEDQELLLLLQQDNTPAFRELFVRYWDKLYFIAHKHLKSTAAAEEIVQDVFMNLWQKRKELVIGALPEYLSAMTRHAVYRCLAREKRMAEFKRFLGRSQEKDLAGERAIDSRMILESVKKLSCQLPEKCRLVFIYNKIDDESLLQVAQRLGISIKTAEAHLTKALRIIRANMTDFLLLLASLAGSSFLH